MYVYMLAMIYTYTYILNAICIPKTETKRERLARGGVSSLFMQGVRPVKYRKYKLVLVLMRGRSHTAQIYPGSSLYGLHQWAESFIY